MLASIVLVACAGPPREAPVRTTDSDEPPLPSAPKTTSPSADFGAFPDDTIAIAGTIVTTAGEPVVGRAYVTVDQNGERRDGVTDVDGLLHVEGLHPPYDLRVGDTAYLGVSRKNPRVEIATDDRSAPPLEVTVGVLAPPAATIIDVISSSLHGTGSASVVATLNANGEAVAVVTLTHQYRARLASDVDVHILVHDLDFTTVGYARVHALADSGFVRPTMVATTEPLYSRARDADLTVTLDVPGGDGVPGASFPIGSRVPVIDGATWRMKATAVAPPTPLALHRSSQAWTGSIAVGSDPPALPLPVGPEITRPLAGGDLSGRGAGLSWGDDPSALFTADVVDEARSTFLYRVIGAATDLPFRRLENLGFSRLHPGAHTLSLATAPFASVDDVVSPDPIARTRRFDERRAGGATYETIPFTAVP